MGCLDFYFRRFGSIFAIKSVFFLNEQILVESTNEITTSHNGEEQLAAVWFAIYTMPRTEKKVHARLLAKGVDVFLPLVTTVRQWSDRKKKVQVPLIPSIVFVRTSLTGLASILACEGVVRVVRFLGKPARIRDYEINNLRLLIHNPNSLYLRESAIQLEEGISVRVVRGPFLGIVGTCVRVQGRHRLVVEIEALGRQIELTLPVSFVETEKMPPVHRSSVAV